MHFAPLRVIRGGAKRETDLDVEWGPPFTQPRGETPHRQAYSQGFVWSGEQS